MPLVQMRIDGVGDLEKNLAVIMRGTGDLRQAWIDFYAPAFYRAEEQFFDSHGDGKWARNQQRYLRWKQRKGFGTDPLVMTGRLRQSLTTGTDPNSVFYPYPDRMVIGTKDPVGNIHYSKQYRYQRKPMDASSPFMQAEFQEAVHEHGEAYEAAWNGRMSLGRLDVGFGNPKPSRRR